MPKPKHLFAEPLQLPEFPTIESVLRQLAEPPPEGHRDLRRAAYQLVDLRGSFALDEDQPKNFIDVRLEKTSPEQATGHGPATVEISGLERRLLLSESRRQIAAPQPQPGAIAITHYGIRYELLGLVRSVDAEDPDVLRLSIETTAMVSREHTAEDAAA